MYLCTTRSCQDLQELVQPTSVAPSCIHHFHTPCPCNLIQALETLVFNHLSSGQHHIGHILTLMPQHLRLNSAFASVQETSVCVIDAGTNLIRSQKQPYDLCVQHEEWRSYVSPKTNMPESRFGYAYYHSNPACIISKWPYFRPQSLVVSSDVQSKPKVDHKSIFCSVFVVHV